MSFGTLKPHAWSCGITSPLQLYVKTCLFITMGSNGGLKPFAHWLTQCPGISSMVTFGMLDDAQISAFGRETLGNTFGRKPPKKRLVKSKLPFPIPSARAEVSTCVSNTELKLHMMEPFAPKNRTEQSWSWSSQLPGHTEGMVGRLLGSVHPPSQHQPWPKPLVQVYRGRR